MGNKIKLLSNINRLDQFIFLGLMILSGFLALLYWQKDFLAIYDASGHLAAVEAARKFWPAISFWNSRELLGWPQGIFYPPLFYWLAAPPSFFFCGGNWGANFLFLALFLL